MHFPVSMGDMIEFMLGFSQISIKLALDSVFLCFRHVLLPCGSDEMPSTFIEGQQKKRPHKSIAVLTWTRLLLFSALLLPGTNVRNDQTKAPRFSSSFSSLCFTFLKELWGPLPLSQDRNHRDSLLDINYAPRPSPCQVLPCLELASLTPF